MTVDLKQFHQVFIEESLEGLDAMENALMDLDVNNIDSETINTIFRSAHSIKGGAGTFGFSCLADFTHILETLLDQIRAGDRQLQADHVDLLLQSVDCMRDMLEMLKEDDNSFTDRALELKSDFEKILNSNSAPAATPQAESLASDEQKTSSDQSLWHIRFNPHEDVIRTGNDPARLIRELSKLGELNCKALINDLPGFANFDPEGCYISWEITLKGDVEKSAIDEIFEWVADESEIIIKQISEQKQADWLIDFKPNDNLFMTGNDPKKLFEELRAHFNVKEIKISEDKLPPLKNMDPERCLLSWQIIVDGVGASQKELEEVFAWVSDDAQITYQQEGLAEEPVDTNTPEQTQSSPANSNAKKAPAKKANSGDASSIRVGIDKVDNLINMVGELVITQSMLGQLGTDFDMSKITKLMEGLGQLEQNTRELQESVMRIRMLPISFAFSRFPRMVRDLSQRLDKKINLEMRGESTELDKTVMEKIGDPLVHLVRNSIDHGIESPEQRLANGKPEEGTIILDAYHQGGNVIIEIIDDGKGLDRNLILTKAIDKGLVNEADAFSLSDEQVYDMIFQPGFSTAKEVSDVSGRGVGMDVVRRNIQALNGSVEIQSKSGEGSTIKISLPLTLAILDGQLVRVSDHTYIFPIVSIVESMQFKEENIHHIAGGCSVFLLREEYVPIIKLHEIFNVEMTEDMGSPLMVVVESDGEKVGVVVNELQAQQQVVIKSLEQNYKRIEGVSGATILGDGTVALIVDIPGIVRLAGIDKVKEQIQRLTFTDSSSARKTA